MIGARSGYLSSSLRNINGAGTVNCPWLIEASTGQRLNITLFKFAPYKTSPLSSSTSVCFEIGVIQEGGVSQGILTCGTDSRQKSIYKSNGGRLMIHFKEKTFLQDIGNFIIHFDGI